MIGKKKNPILFFYQRSENRRVWTSVEASSLMHKDLKGNMSYVRNHLLLSLTHTSPWSVLGLVVGGGFCCRGNGCGPHLCAHRRLWGRLEESAAASSAVKDDLIEERSDFSRLLNLWSKGTKLKCIWLTQECDELKEPSQRADMIRSHSNKGLDGMNVTHWFSWQKLIQDGRHGDSSEEVLMSMCWWLSNYCVNFISTSVP